MDTRHYTPFDELVINFDQALRTLFGRPQTTGRPNPADAEPEQELDEAERRESARLLRVDHAGEVCAQALYQGQALTARLERVRENMEQAAREENDHLDWCAQRVHELGSHTSLLNPLWYAGSFSLGALAGALGDKWSLGFVAETERQVIEHLDSHLQRLPPRDLKSRAILEQMKIDEAQHGNTAMQAGGAPLPAPVRGLMRLTSKLMTGSSYWL
ncbi:2-polyprenyl-3-methyl-6-methoxy-1,4-benzoquinone monooxygenase [Thiohalobacter sp. IOR34]|uniref:2-polyprenyl-3-methyl-6-methoxy-1,4-benzoquinone monooxygenase n=1 Tax=Thiohalobacter sp. IOR34 TaxID=3057176 RepID=UPI0025B0106E|nr:2-polyprenyl-3-methyl-6-methoxy-1,4-benzoquinone monooxygenase [Thiohalobacter sp. IOR34]WJW75852.1 2-polyprenyl-3-methyl-6-methoxy-1,4-benzoquinone monooxygenase [Thiohalobacter sp. IOR34]